MAENESIFPQPDVLNESEYGKFVLTNLAAKRAKQIKEGAPPLVRIDSSHPLSIALAEIAAGKIKPLFGEEAELMEGEEIEGLEEFDNEGFLLPGLDDDEDTADDSTEESGDEDGANALADLLAAGDSTEEEAAPSADAEVEISLDDLAAEEEKEQGESEDES